MPAASADVGNLGKRIETVQQCRCPQRFPVCEIQRCTISDRNNWLGRFLLPQSRLSRQAPSGQLRRSRRLYRLLGVRDAKSPSFSALRCDTGWPTTVRAKTTTYAEYRKAAAIEATGNAVTRGLAPAASRRV